MHMNLSELRELVMDEAWCGAILGHSAFFVVQLSHPYMTTGKTIALTRQTFVDKAISLLFNMLSRLFFGRNDAKAETPVLWPPHVKS